MFVKIARKEKIFTKSYLFILINMNTCSKPGNYPYMEHNTTKYHALSSANDLVHFFSLLGFLKGLNAFQSFN